MSLFQKINQGITNQQAEDIARAGVVPSNMKDPEDKVYFIIFRSYSIMPTSDIAGRVDENGHEQPFYIDGEALIVEGRHNAFTKIKEFIDGDFCNSIDMRLSLVMVEGVDAGKSISMYRFLKLCNRSYPNEKFNEELLESYITGFNDESEFREQEEKAISATGFGGNAGTITNEEEE